MNQQPSLKFSFKAPFSQIHFHFQPNLNFISEKMIGESFAGDFDCGNFFDHIDDFLDFPTEELDDLAFTTNAAAAFPPIWTADHSLPAADEVFSGNSGHSALSAAISVPYDDIVQMEWLSNFVDDSFAGPGAGTLTINTSTLSPSNQFLSTSPVSVLDTSSSSSSSSSSGDKETTVATAGKRGRARTKRPRPPSFIPRPPQRTAPTDSGGKVSSDSENAAESCSAPPPAKKPKKLKLTFRREQNGGPQGVRKCLHCEITKTPQWRAGPLGPKTLCNACGVRHKSGRLFPEYRPAASPTFVPCFHSNSHKKVLEMRTKQGGNAAEESPPELIPNTNTGIVLGFV